MCGETHTYIPRDTCAGNTHPWETHIPVTPDQFFPKILVRVGPIFLKKWSGFENFGPGACLLSCFEKDNTDYNYSYPRAEVHDLK